MHATGSGGSAPSQPSQETRFTSQQKFIVALLAFLQFTVILDFMILAPLGALLMPTLHITPAQFGMVVSAYAFSAGVSGVLAAGFADRYDRKTLLLFFYVGFIIGTLLCGLATSFHSLLAARVITGLFGGVISSISFAIITDIFSFAMRGRVMGLIQTAFAASQVLGIPAGLFFSNHWGWHAPFFLIVGVSLVVACAAYLRLQPINDHLKLQTDRTAFTHLLHTVMNRRYLLPFLTTALLSIGGFLIMPFGSAFTVNNLGIAVDRLPMIYLITGLASLFVGPMVGRASDAFGKFRCFAFGTMLMTVMVLTYTNLDVTPLPWVIIINILMFVGIFSRMIPSQALMSGIPSPESRGSFMSISSSLQQIAGGVASILAGLVVVEGVGGRLEHFNVLGYIMVTTGFISLALMYQVHKMVPEPAVSGARNPIDH